MNIPAMHRDAKAACPDALLLFRIGDFYEAFYDDAKQIAKLIGLTLTTRDKCADPIPMAGFPHHSLESYLRKLVAAGRRVAILEQVADSKQIPRREVQRIVSPAVSTLRHGYWRCGECSSALDNADSTCNVCRAKNAPPETLQDRPEHTVTCHHCGDTWRDRQPDLPGQLVWCGQCDRTQPAKTKTILEKKQQLALFA